MDIAIVSNTTLRIKSKQSSLVVDPWESMPKTQGDFIIALSKNQNIETVKVEGFRVKISGSGEYEIGGIKLSVSAFGDDLLYSLVVDGINILLANSECLKKAKEKIKESHVVIIKADSVIDEASVTAASPSLVLLYGESAAEGAKVLGKQDIKPVNKYSSTLEKLPTEMEVVILK